jgi:hypothetical protein
MRILEFTLLLIFSASLSACMPSVRNQRLSVYDDRVADCNEWSYDVFECRRLYGCERKMGPEACGAQMLKVLNDPKKVHVF